jgi:hypothetical protein
MVSNEKSTTSSNLRNNNKTQSSNYTKFINRKNFFANKSNKTDIAAEHENNKNLLGPNSYFKSSNKNNNNNNLFRIKLFEYYLNKKQQLQQRRKQLNKNNNNSNKMIENSAECIDDSIMQKLNLFFHKMITFSHADATLSIRYFKKMTYKTRNKCSGEARGRNVLCIGFFSIKNQSTDGFISRPNILIDVYYAGLFRKRLISNIDLVGKLKPAETRKIDLRFLIRIGDYLDPKLIKLNIFIIGEFTKTQGAIFLSKTGPENRVQVLGGAAISLDEYLDSFIATE